jgi:tetratricopeptide (TPR) repeat protein
MTRVFISYSHRDEAWKDRVVSHLGVLAGEGLETWDDRRIDGGDTWQAEIEQAIANCDVALLLISRHFLTSKFILGKEVPALLKRREQEGVRIIPIILSPCQWTRIPWIKPIQARPKDGKALTGMTEHQAEEALSTLAGEIADLHPAFHERGGHHRKWGGGEGTATRIKVDLSHLPAGAPHFLAREQELAQLDAAWADEHCAIVQLIAPGGVGKTALVKRWLDNLSHDTWRGATRVFGWSFYSQGTRDDLQASEDPFLSAALEWFGVRHNPALNPAEKGRLLAQALTEQPTLLVLDGVEPLQHPPGVLGGQLRAPGLQTMLDHLVHSGQRGLCVLSSRQAFTDLAEYERAPNHPKGRVIRVDMGNLSREDGARLLHELGVRVAGADAIGPDDDELKLASDAVQGHALTLSLLGRYLALAFDGDIRKRDQVEFSEADADITGGHCFKVMHAYELWLARAGREGEQLLAALRLLGFFDRPAPLASLQALRNPPAIPGLTEPIIGLNPRQWNLLLNRLKQLGPVFPSNNHTALDAHTLVRDYFAQRLQQEKPNTWREGHRRIYEQLKACVPYRPDDLLGLQPLYQAVAHGCKAGQWKEALDKVYIDRILRGMGQNGSYSWKILGAFGSNLGALACFFLEPWGRLASLLREAEQAWLLNETAIQLRALGRLEEALESMREGVERVNQHQHLNNAAISYINLSELQLCLGQVGMAAANAAWSVNYADRTSEWSWRTISRTTLADAQLQHDATPSMAINLFADAEELQARWQPDHPQLYSLGCFRYCDSLLWEAERRAWLRVLKVITLYPSPDGESSATALQACATVTERAEQALGLAESASSSPMLDSALQHLTLARCALYTHLLTVTSCALDTARSEVEQAVDRLRTAGRQDYLPRSLLTRAWVSVRLGDTAAARADLAEVERIARRGNMRLHLADFHLHHARLFPEDRAQYHLAQARALIEQCEYFRRLPELEEAEAALGSGDGQAG